MCTPDNMPPLCSCPHDTARLVSAGKTVAAAVFVGGVAWAGTAGYGWWLALAGWVLLMGTAGLVSLGRDRRAREAATIALEVQGDGRGRRAVPAGASADDDVDGLRGVLLRGGAPGSAAARSVARRTG